MVPLMLSDSLNCITSDSVPTESLSKHDIKQPLGI